VESIKQTFFTVDDEKKFELLVRVIKRERPLNFCAFFSRTFAALDRLYNHNGRWSAVFSAIPGRLGAEYTNCGKVASRRRSFPGTPYSSCGMR
jgi:hypothetical protein